jgi:putative intracellular protease/amidase
MSSARCISPVLAWILAVGLVVGVAPPASAARYVCPPCGASCDSKAFDHPGTCPQCGMTLVDAASAAARPAPDRGKVAILLFDGVEIIDSMGPYEVFGAAGFDVFTVAATRQPVTSAMGQVLVPKHTFGDTPQADVLVVPGGGIGGALHDPRTLDWIRTASAKSKLTMSVCNGAFILAEAGLLDGLSATTTAPNIPKLRAQYPKVRVVDDQRFVDNGHVITTGGLSAGIDGALHVVERLHGAGEAQQVALGEEYDWTTKARFARAALADQLIPDVPMDRLGRWNVVKTEGDTSHWELVLQGKSDLTKEALSDQVGRELADRGKWVTPAGEGGAGRETKTWRFKGRKGEPWDATMSIEPKGDRHEYTVRLFIARVG